MVKDEDMFKAFRLCLRHKMSSPSAIKYIYGFEEDLIRLCDEINGRTYHPTTSTTFVVTKPKPREVFAANFRDRIIHHYIAMRIEPILESMFTDRTFNCRKEKGVLYGVRRLYDDIRDCSDGYTRDCWVMKLDLQGFFMSIDKNLLDVMLHRFIEDNYFGDDKEDILWLAHLVVTHSPEKDCDRISPKEMWDLLPANKSLFTNGEGYGLPIGNLSSQHFANFLLHWLDVAIEKLGFKYHGRYVDDFYIVSTDKEYMLASVPILRRFLSLYLHTRIHPKKFYLQHYTKGVAFTGAMVKPGRVYAGKRTVSNFYEAMYKVNRSWSMKELRHGIQSVNSYLGLMRHYDTYHIRRSCLSEMDAGVWGKVYIEGRFWSLRLKDERRSLRGRR